MKRWLCFLLALILLVPGASFLIHAETVTEETPPPYKPLKDNALSYTCSYDPKQGSIVLSGMVSHDTMIRYPDYRIEVYRVSPGETIQTVLSGEAPEPLAGAEISVRFNFSLSAQTTVERFSGYVVALRSPSKELYLNEAPIYAEIPSAEQKTDRDPLSYKGVSFSDVSISSNLGAGTTVIPVYLDRMIGKSSTGYLYHVDQSYRYFDKEYVDQLDAQIRSHSFSGCRVYLQLLLPESGLSFSLVDEPVAMAKYYMPDVYSSENLPLLSAISSFLVKRYDSEKSGKIQGFVLGSQIDRRAYNEHGELSSKDRYAELYAYYFLVMGGSARAIRPDLDLVIPFSDRNDYQKSLDDAYYSPSGLLESILSCLTSMGSPEVSCMTMIEAAVTPYGITDDFLQVPREQSYEPDPARLEVDLLTQYEEYLTDLSRQYDNAPTDYLYRWIPEESLDGLSLACAYGYGYYAALRATGLVSFIVSPETQVQMDDLSRILRDVDTQNSRTATEHLLPYFQVESWGELLGGRNSHEPRKRFVCNLLSQGADSFKGSFSFMDLSSGNLNDWFSGVGCGVIRSGYDQDGDKGVYTQMTPSENGKYSEMICHFEYPESLIYTPYLELIVLIQDSVTPKDLLYEVTVTVGNQEAVATASKILYGGDRISLVLDLRDFSADYLAKYLKFSVRTVHGEAVPLQLWMLGMNGFSTDHSSEELEELVAKERARIRDQHQDSDSDQGKELQTWAVVLTIVVLSFLGIFLIVKINSEDRTGKKGTPPSETEDQPK